jgi:hypothetical protein
MYNSGTIMAKTHPTPRGTGEGEKKKKRPAKNSIKPRFVKPTPNPSISQHSTAAKTLYRHDHREGKTRQQPINKKAKTDVPDDTTTDVGGWWVGAAVGVGGNAKKKKKKKRVLQSV